MCTEADPHAHTHTHTLQGEQNSIRSKLDVIPDELPKSRRE